MEKLQELALTNKENLKVCLPCIGNFLSILEGEGSELEKNQIKSAPLFWSAEA